MALATFPCEDTMPDDTDSASPFASSGANHRGYERMFDKLDEMGKTLNGMAVAYGRMEEQVKGIREHVSTLGPLRDAVQENAAKLEAHTEALGDMRKRLGVVESHQRDPDPAKHLSMDQLAAVKAHMADGDIHVTTDEKQSVKHSLTRAGKQEDYWATAWPQLLMSGTALMVAAVTLLHGLGVF